MIILVPIAFVSGVLVALSPCVLPILPVVLASGIDGNNKRIKGVIAGIVVSFTLVVLLLATIVGTISVAADSFRNAAVALLVLFGLGMVFPQVWERLQTFLDKYWKFKPVQSAGGGFAGGFVTGVSLGVVWTPCVGPIIAAVATLAAVSSITPMSALLVFSFSLGAAVPLYFIAKGGNAVSAKLGYLKQNSIVIRQVFGVIILTTALMIFSGVDRRFQEWSLNALPESWTQITTSFEQRFNAEELLKNMMGVTLEPAEPGATVVRDVRLASDFTGAKVDRGDLIKGCFAGKDCIPSIDRPVFEDAESASSWLRDTDVVFAVNLNGVQKAYAQRILNWHEIVNDEIGGNEVAITFCPLCGSALAFERVVGGVITEFGVSGFLHNSDLVMYDRYEGNLWQQITGEAIVGPAAQRGEILKQIPIITTTWEQWRMQHPDTLVLSLDTGFSRNYDRYPYGAYEEDDELYFGVEGLDTTLQIKTVVYGIEVKGESKAYPEQAFDDEPEIVDMISGVEVRLERMEDGAVTAVNLQTGEEIIPVRLFWFAWAAFHPDTELYRSK